MRTSWLFAILFSLLICWNPSLGAIDDRIFLLPFNLFQCWGNGRFYILDGLEQTILNHFFGTSPFLFYLVNALEFLGLFWIWSRLTRKPWIAVLLALTPGLCTAYFRVFVPERLLVLLFSVIVLLDQRESKSSRSKIIYIFVAFLSYFLKEPAFLVIGGLSFLRWLEKKDRPFHVFMMALSAGYGALLFYLTRVLKTPDASYGVMEHSGLALLVKNIFNFTLNDPLIVFFALPLFFAGLLRKRLDPYPTLIAGYFAVFLALGLYQEYYLLPLAPFLVILLLQKWQSLPKFSRIFLMLLLGNTFLAGVAQISIYKNEPRGFQEMIRAIAAQPVTADTKVCFLGLHEGVSKEILSSSSLFYRHLRSDSADPKFVGIKEGQDTSTCQYLVDSPYNFDRMVAPEGYREFQHFIPTISIPNHSIRSWIKWFSLKSGRDGITDKNIFRKQDFISFSRP